MLCLLSLVLFLTGNCGLSADIPLPKSDPHGAYASLFAEELGLVMEVRASEAASVVEAYKKAGLHASLIGKVSAFVVCPLAYMSVARLMMKTFSNNH
jgi:hypothetical protein